MDDILRMGGVSPFIIMRHFKRRLFGAQALKIVRGLSRPRPQINESSVHIFSDVFRHMESVGI